MIKIFGHKSPDTDSTGSPILWAWYLTNIEAVEAMAKLTGPPNNEASFVLNYWNVKQPEIIDDVDDGEEVIIVDTNNIGELPRNIANAKIVGIIDHHLLQGGLKTNTPINITVRPLACTATIMLDLMGPKTVAQLPREMKGIALSCILSDTLEFRSPTTTAHDQQVAEMLARDLNVNIPAYANEMFAAKSDMSMFSDSELLAVDSKQFDINGKKLKISVLETTSPKQILDRKETLIDSMAAFTTQECVDEILLFVVDILNESSTLLIQNETVRSICQNSFGVFDEGDAIELPGIVSRKKQIIPSLKV
ncbi:MAG: manganese-dependent inorganic pyrophosphatase [Rhodobacteraceae bacterium]|nr:manganese-dependent inorganic pyrophosphatase [Paracoccaceae bacterium]